MTELKPCPFCGCGAKAYLFDGEWQVECFVCHARAWWADSKEEAEAKWNQRTEEVELHHVGCDEAMMGYDK